MMKRSFLFNCFLILSSSVIGQTPASRVSVESLPESNIDIPIFINLKPIYALAERNVSTVFTSPNYPNDWVQADCATRYKYHFRRSPLQMSMNGTTLNLSFLGYYKIIGSTRICANGTVLSPWTPSCRCGFDESERKVSIGFTSSFSLSPNYLLRTKILRNEPKALDKCEVCFWGQDVTKSVIDGLKAELDLSKKAMEDSFSTINIRPYMQRVWSMLGSVYNLPNVGYFSLNPKKLRMQDIKAVNDMLAINIGISATPAVSFTKTNSPATPLPDLSTANNKNGFNIFLEAALQYDSLTNVLNGYLVNKRFDVVDGLIKKYIIVKKTAVAGNTNGELQIQLEFTGSFNGTAFFHGKPSYNAATKTIEVENLEYDLQTKNLLLKTAKWLFNKRIANELKKYTSFSLASYFELAAKSLNASINKEWMKGIKSFGKVEDLKLTSLHALPDHLLIRSNCSGKMSVLVNEIDPKL